MYPSPTLPSTGGGLIAGSAGLIMGSVWGNLLIVIVSMIIIGLTAFRFIRLRHGEKKLSRGSRTNN